MLAGPIVLAPLDAVLAGCKPDHFRPLFFLKSMGACAFDSETLSFAGTPVEQALCLMRGMDSSRNLEPRLPSLPAALAERSAVARHFERLPLHAGARGRVWRFSLAAGVARSR
jgi:hypothetical protein